MKRDSYEWRFKTLLVMVGLPARGKSYIAKKIVNYHCWLGLNAKFFNVGDHRRNVCKEKPQNADFFSGSNTEAKQARENIAWEVLEDLLQWLETEGDVAVFDATNTTNARRKGLMDKCRKVSTELNVIFIESICDDPNVIHQNCMQKVAGSPDYRNMSIDEALKDLLQRISNYEKVYETITDDSLSYIKLINLQSKVICNKIFGSTAQNTASFLMSLNIVQRKIWLCRAGQIEGVEDYNNIGMILSAENINREAERQEHKVKEQRKESGEEETSPKFKPRLGRRDSYGYFLFRPNETFSNSNQNQNQNQNQNPNQNIQKQLHLGTKGKVFAVKLKSFIDERVPDISSLQIYTSTIPRAVETVKAISPRTEQWTGLNMLDTGTLDGMSIYEIKKFFPEDFFEFSKDPFHYRLPGGESFEDVVHRVEPFIIELERQTKSALVVSHLTTLRIIMAYFLGLPIEHFSTIDIPQNTVIQLVPSQYGWEQTRFDLSGP